MQISSRGGLPVERFFEYALLCMLASGYLALAGSGYFARLPVVATGAALVLRAHMVSGILRLRLPSRAVTAATLVYLGFYAVDYFYLSRSFVQSTVHLIFFLAIVKILTASTDRDYVYVKIIAWTELLAASLYSENSAFLFYLGLFLLASIAVFLSDEIRCSSRRAPPAPWPARFPTGRLAAFSLVLSLGILVLATGLFFLLPRTARAAMRRFTPEHYRLTGFTSEVDLGAIGEIERQSTPVMHVRSEDGRPLPPGLKWRGAALAAFDGKRWYNPVGLGLSTLVTSIRRGLFVLANGDRQRSETPRATYIVHLNDVAGETLFFAGRPEFLWLDAPVVERTSPGTFRRRFERSASVVYQARSFLSSSDGAPESEPADWSEPARSIYLQLPPVDARVVLLARNITRGLTSDFARARAIERYLPEHYAYTLDLPAKQPRDPIAYFLFDRKRGHCEYFASTMAVMLRTLGIPSRVITGFQGGIYNPIDHQQIIRASDAHSWVEAYLPRLGWTTFDPTPAAPAPASNAFFERLSLYLDAADVFWQEWVLDYSLDHQVLLATRMQDASRRISMNWPDRIAGWTSVRAAAAAQFLRRDGLNLLAAVIAAGLLGGFGPNLFRRWRDHLRLRRALSGEARSSDAAHLYQRMLRILHRRGIERPAWLTPLEFSSSVRDPALADLTRQVAAAYNDFRFGGRPDGAARMAELIERMEHL
jgi:transglutaminase-like putative cysteine protease